MVVSTSFTAAALLPISARPRGRRVGRTVSFVPVPMRHCRRRRVSASAATPSPQQPLCDGDPDRTGVPAPTSRDPISLPRPLTSADLMEPTGDGLKVAYQAVENWVADRAVLPLENSLGGSIHRNYDLLLRHRLHIVGEVRLAVRHCLLANRGVKIENLRSAMSHPQALAQCEQTLTRLGIEHREAVDDTAGAAKNKSSKTLERLQVHWLLNFMDWIFSQKTSRHFDYLFYVDLEASMADPNAQNALGNLKEFATFLRVLGSYPTDVSEA
ncbi:hypothetical protein PR202_gb22129 [Eleusine coracana subsp. coracana]|uniref:Prephenate dehydratase domain-containing protein n=1 Tax=Eleusine coracana subsp. coracana TaxID=191504 RepID=A0AAV5FGG7_ELECO|nr:hypothetical protein PR202_gb22129 [Eleusine coracana subsp. coracana]